MKVDPVSTDAAAARAPGARPCACGKAEHTGLALTSLQPGQTGVVCETCMDPADAAMVRAMGLRPNATVRLCRLGEPCIVEVLGGVVEGSGGLCSRPDCRCRLGLARELAERVRVVGVS